MQASKKRQDQLLQSGQSSPSPQHSQSIGQQTQAQSLQLPQTSVLSSLRNTSKSPIGLVPTTPSPSQYNNSIPQNGRRSPFAQPPPPPGRSSPSSPLLSHQQQYSNMSSDVDPYSGSSVHRRKGAGGRGDDFHGQYENDSESAGPASMLYQQQQQAPLIDQVCRLEKAPLEYHAWLC